MPLDKAIARGKMKDWDHLLQSFSLPQWEDFPSLSLYMDQVIFLLNQYVSLVSLEGEDKIVTSAMINNYVKLKIIPPPVKKRYGRAHLAYLIMVCILKQTISTGEIRRLLPISLREEQVEALYAQFTSILKEQKDVFQERARAAAAKVLDDERYEMNRLIFQAAVQANLSQTLAKQLLTLYDAPGQEADN